MSEVEVSSTPSPIQSLVNSLLIRSATDPVILTVLQEMLNELNRLGIAVFGAPTLPGESPITLTVAPEAPTDFIYQLTPNNVILSWTPATADFVYYELRKGATWESADKILTTNNIQVVLNPVLIGHHNYLIRAINSEGIYSTGVASVGFDIPPLGIITVVSTVVTNSITLSWSIPSSTFRVDYYIVKRNGVQISTTAGTFFAISEQVSGNYTYSITGVDIAGNKSPEAEAKVYTTGVTDYIFYSKLSWKANGTAVNSKASGGRLYFCVLNETYQQHFSSRGWNSPQAQVNAGYTPWLSPFATTGSYEEVFDFGTVVSNVIITTSFNYEIYYGSFTFGQEVRTSTDGITYSAPETTSSFFTTSVRYVKVKISITAQNDKSFMSLKDISVSLNVKRENDGGESTSYATDPLGTSVNFNKSFVDVEGITVTPISDSSTFATHAFDDVPHPTSFRVRIFDNAGVRITRGFRWNARGIV